MLGYSRFHVSVRKSTGPLLAACLILNVCALPAAADVVAENTAAGIVNVSGPVYVGETFTTGGTGSYDHLVFNFYLNSSQSTPEAVGTAYLLSQSYTGTVGNLSSSSPGFIASATASGGYYTFSPGATVQANTTYYLYENGGLSEFGATSTGPATYTALSLGGSFSPYGSSAMFVLTGDQTGVPEPSFVAMTAVVAIGLGIARFRRRRKVAAAV